ncbi:MAG: M23 family metallopeptidase [Myxococcales bacterium]|nr:M23 family metallopeptidase [Myxococcales bacterium]
MSAALLVACGGPASDDGGAPSRVAAITDAGALDASPPDASPPDAGLVDAGAAAWTRLTTTDGATIEGELVARYDHARWWWDPAAEETLALFDPRGLAEWPDDRSLTFVSSLDVAGLAAVARPDGLSSYRDAMRDRGVRLERVPLDGVAYVITAGERYHLEESGYGDFAWDLVVLDAEGRSHSGDGLSNEDYLVWDREVRLPVSGIVVEVVADAPDVPPGPADLSAVNNLVGVQVYGGYYVYLLHLRQGSVPPEVVVGARLDAGTVIGRAGNSGVSAEPHVHVVALAWDRDADPPRTWSVPAEWHDVWVGPRAGTRREWVAPWSGDYVSNDPF